MFENDDDDFVLSPNSNLSSIFNSSSSYVQGNSNLTYTAPKQPKPLDNSNSPTQSNNNISSVDGKGDSQSQSAVLLAKVIVLWKLENGKNRSLGKFMVAIIKNNPTGLHDMIIYQKKDFILIRVVLGTSVTFFKYPNNFLAFNDYNSQLWNLNFNSTSDLETFTEFVSKQDCVVVDQTSESIAEKDESVVRSNNISATCQNEKTDSKARILSKITKVGHSILPITIERTKSSELSDSSSDSSSTDSPPLKPTVVPRKSRASSVENKTLSPIVPITTTTTLSNMSNNYFIPHSNNQIALNPTNLVYAQAMPDLGFGNFLAAQNAELKANLAEINMKLNSVLQSRDSNGNIKERDESSSLQTKIKCQKLKIDNLATELERCRKSLQKMEAQYKEKCEELDGVLIEKNRTEELELIQTNMDQLKTDLKTKTEIIQSQNIKINELEQAHNSSKLMVANLDKENKELKFQLEQQQIQLDQLRNQITEQDKSVDKEKINKVVKESMNEAFRDIIGRFNENDSYSLNDIQMALLDNLKKTSYKLMTALS